MFVVTDPFCLSLKTTIQQVENYQRSDSSFDRHIQTRACIVELFLRIAFRGAVETLHAFALLSFAAVQLVFNTYLGDLIPYSINPVAITPHFKLSKQCALALILDLPAALIDPNQAHKRLINRQLIRMEPAQLTKMEQIRKQAFILLTSAAKGAVNMLLVGCAIVVSIRVFGITRIPRFVEVCVESVLPPLLIFCVLVSGGPIIY